MPKKPVAVSLRKPQPVDVNAFVADGERTPAKPDAPIVDAVVRHANREYRELTLYLPTETARQLSFYCMDENRDVNGVVADAVTQFVGAEQAEAEMPAEPEPPTPAQFIELSRKSLRVLWALRPWALKPIS